MIREIASKLYEDRYIDEYSIPLSEEELRQILDLIIEWSGRDIWRLIQHKNIDSKETWYELELEAGYSESFFENIEWLKYTR